MFAKMSDEKNKGKDVEEKAEELMREIIRINYAAAGEISGAIDKGQTAQFTGRCDNR